MVENVIYAIQACKYPAQLCSTWSVTCTNSHYIVNGTLPLDFDVSMVDMELIHSVSPLRINCISIVQTNHGAQNKLQVKISNCRQRLQLTEVLTCGLSVGLFDDYLFRVISLLRGRREGFSNNEFFKEFVAFVS